MSATLCVAVADPYLVLFVVDPAEDEHAGAFADLARAMGNCTAWFCPIGLPNTTRSLA